MKIFYATLLCALSMTGSWRAAQQMNMDNVISTSGSASRGNIVQVVEQALQANINVEKIIKQIVRIASQINLSGDFNRDANIIRNFAQNLVRSIPDELLGINVASIKAGNIPPVVVANFRRYAPLAQETLEKVFPFLEHPDAAINALDSLYNKINPYIPGNLRSIINNVTGSGGLIGLLKGNRAEVVTICGALKPYLQKLIDSIRAVNNALAQNPMMNAVQVADLIGKTFDVDELTRFARIAYPAVTSFVTRRDVVDQINNLAKVIEGFDLSSVNFPEVYRKARMIF